MSVNSDTTNLQTGENEHIYICPVRCVKTPNDMALWEKSEAFFDIVGFINSISQVIQGVKITDQLEESPIVAGIINLLNQFEVLLDETPAIDQPQRFGNKAYRDWFEKMENNSENYLQNVLPEHLHSAIVEIDVYLRNSFGNPTRIDYGTGHELTFIMFLCCLFKIKALNEKDSVATGIKIFSKYLQLVRKLQLTYRMEPAGSHGVWSLDDYQFVPFIWGSAQFSSRSPIRPAQFLEDDVIKEHKDANMYISSIDYINKVKTGLFAEHSPQLWSISGVESWVKINTGLCKMYQKELLGKFPVVQHVLFGSLMQFKAVKPGTQLSIPRLGMGPPSRILSKSVLNN